MDDLVLKRKAYDRLLEWKNESHGETAILIEGARLTGKSFLAKRFAENEYRSAIIMDFRKLKKRIKDAFLNDAEDLDLLFDKLSFEFKAPYTGANPSSYSTRSSCSPVRGSSSRYSWQTGGTISSRRDHWCRYRRT